MLYVTRVVVVCCWLVDWVGLCDLLVGLIGVVCDTRLGVAAADWITASAMYTILIFNMAPPTWAIMGSLDHSLLYMTLISSLMTKNYKIYANYTALNHQSTHSWLHFECILGLTSCFDETFFVFDMLVRWIWMIFWTNFVISAKWVRFIFEGGGIFRVSSHRQADFGAYLIATNQMYTRDIIHYSKQAGRQCKISMDFQWEKPA